MITLEAVPLAGAGPEWDGVFAAGPGLQSRRLWFEAVAEAAVPPGARAEVLLLRDGVVPLAAVPVLAGPGRRLASLTTPYTCLYQPLVAPGATDRQLEGVGAAFGRLCRRRPVTLLEAMDPAWPGLPAFLRGAASAGLAVLRFAHFGNWHQGVRGWTWEAYLAARPGRLRETVRRKTRLCERDGTVRLQVAQSPAEVEPALAAYEEVYRRSWKPAEPFPHFNQALLRRAAAAGAARVGVMWRDGQPVAAQYWTVADGVATVLKLAHVDGEERLSPGTVLTAHVIAGLLREGGLAVLDFGRGDDEYKRLWVERRAQRVGVVLATPWLPGGLGAVLRHQAGRLRAFGAAKLHAARSITT